MVRSTMVRTTLMSSALFALLIPTFPIASDAHADATSIRRHDTTSATVTSATLESTQYLVSASTLGSCRTSMKAKAARSGNAEGARWGCGSDDRTAFMTVSATSDADAAARFSEPEWQDVQAVHLAALAPQAQGRRLPEKGGM